MVYLDAQVRSSARPPRRLEDEVGPGERDHAGQRDLEVGHAVAIIVAPDPVSVPSYEGAKLARGARKGRVPMKVKA